MNKSEVLQFIIKARQKKIKELDLSNKGITELPDELGNFTELKSLNLSYNNITVLPQSICNLINLKKLLLTRNNITKLPVGICNLLQLEILDLSYNSFVKIPSEIGQFSNLSFFDASFCELRTLPLSLTDLIGLKTLNLEENPLVFPPQKVIKRGLYAVMHYLTLEKRKKEASRVMMQIFNMPEKIQAAFRQYIKYFNQMVSKANHKDVVFDINFINQDFYQEMDINSEVESYLYDIMQYIQEKVVAIKHTGGLDNDITSVYYESRISELKTRLSQFNSSLDDKIEDIKKIKKEIKGLHDSLED